MWTNGAFFEQNPEKVCGEIFTHNPNTGKLLTNQFGEPKAEVRGTIKDLEKIKAPEVRRYDHYVPEHSSKTVQEKPKLQKSRIQKAISATRRDSQPVDNSKFNLLTLEESIKLYNTNVEYKTDDGKTAYYTISEEEIKVWVTYQVREKLYKEEVIRNNAWGNYLVDNPSWEEWQKAGLVAYDGEKYIPEALFYAGNIYERIRQVKSKEAAIAAKIGQEAYDKQLAKLEASKPLPLLITEDDARKLHLSPFDKIWEDFEPTTYADGTESDGTFWNDFYRWMTGLPEEDFATEDGKFTTAYEIYNYWLLKERFRRGTDEDEKAAIRRNVSLLGSVLFDRFLIEQLSRDDKNRITAEWNSKRNNYRPIAYHKIPVGFEHNRKFKGGTLKIRPAQREGVAFMNSRGTGIIAYDVGVGKTMTSILGIIDGFLKGMFSRVLIPVPQKVYKKWIGEINGVYAEKNIYEQKVNPKTGKKKRGKLRHKEGELMAEGILPHIPVQDYDNLGVNFLSRAMDESGMAFRVPENSITMVTYEGVVKIGFNEDTENELANRLRSALSQGESGRAKAIQDERSSQWIDDALKNTEFDIEDMGIDAIIVDEAHNFRNLFMEVKGDVGDDGEREQKNFYSGSSGKPSARALSLFMLNAYVQEQNGLRNTFGLTATPFTNRATEIYSMMALYDYLGMREFDVYNIAQFCTSFIDEKIEDSWTAAGKFEPKPVIRGYNNLPILQSMVFRSIIYKTGEDANIQRPEKILLPLKNDENGAPLPLEYQVDTKLVPSNRQAEWMAEITKFADGALEGTKLNDYYMPIDGKIPGRVLIALNAARVVTFSPFALNLGGESVVDKETITPEQFVDGSPKIKYTVECIRSVKKYHQEQGTFESGQIIYSDRGTEWFGHIKQYLVENVGYRPDEVRQFHGGVSKGQREKIKEGFLAGEIKVIIGSSTMREGVDLQKNGSVIYVCYIDWNPTDMHQLFGRIWRFGNKFSHVRVVVPLIENSSDIFTWQKLSEKMSRLNSIWTRSDNTKMFEESELNPEELKRALINEPSGLAKYQVQEEVQSIKSNLRIVEGKLNRLREAQSIRDRYEDGTARLRRLAEEAITDPQRLAWDVGQKQVDKLKEKEITDQQSIYRIVRQYAKLRSYDGETLKGYVEEHISWTKKLKKLEEQILTPFSLKISDDFTPVILDFEQKEAEMTGRLQEKKSPEYFERLVEQYTQEKAEEQANRRSIQARVEEFQRLNYLLDCEYGIHNCDIFGRIEVIESGEVLDTPRQAAPVVESTEYNMSALLRQMTGRVQQAAIREILQGEEGLGYIDQVLRPLEDQLAAIPKQQPDKQADGSDRGSDYLIVYAHYFLGGWDWYVLEFDGMDRLFCAVTSPDTYGEPELGYSQLTEILSAKQQVEVVGMGSFNQPAELDFFWTPKYLWQLKAELGREGSAGFMTLEEALSRGIEKPIGGTEPEYEKHVDVRKEPPAPGPKAETTGREAEMSGREAEMSGQEALDEAIEALLTALEFAAEEESQELQEAVEALQVAKEFA